MSERKNLDLGFKTRTERVGNKEFSFISVEKDEMKKLIPVILTSSSLGEVLEKIEKDQIRLPHESEKARALIAYFYTKVTKLVRIPCSIKQRDDLINSIQILVPPIQVRIIQQLTIWSYNMKDKISAEGEVEALDKVTKDPACLSDRPLWRLIR